MEGIEMQKINGHYREISFARERAPLPAALAEAAPDVTRARAARRRLSGRRKS
jgi:hypothetical protein